jgi:hypothetical protein
MSATARPRATPSATTPFDTRGLGLDALMQVALRTRPDAVMLREPARRAAWSGAAERTWSAAEIDRQAERLRALIGLARLPAEARALILAPLGAELIASLLAALRAGLTPVLPPLNASQAELQADLDRAGPVVALAVSRCGDLEPARLLRDACARTFNARLVAAFGPDAPDGVAALDAILASEAPLGEAPAAPAGAAPLVHVRDAAGQSAALDEASVVAAAVELGRQARITGQGRILSLMMGADLAALASGPYLAAVTGAELLPLGHFQLSALWAALAEGVPTCLVAPASIEAALAEAGIIGHEGVNSVVLIHRDDRGAAASATTRGVIDVLRQADGSLAIMPRG